MTESKDVENSNKKGWQNRGIMNYSDNEKQTVFRLFGIEMTAPASLKNPGTIYISFIVINILLFTLLKNLVFSQ